jgi:hypothetical protein
MTNRKVLALAAIMVSPIVASLLPTQVPQVVGVLVHVFLFPGGWVVGPVVVSGFLAVLIGAGFYGLWIYLGGLALGQDEQLSAFIAL